MELELKKLTKEFQGFKAVDDITLTMSNGVYGLLGVNGAGKTTLMRMLCTLIKPTSGSILCDGKDISMKISYHARVLLSINVLMHFLHKVIKHKKSTSDSSFK